MTNLDAFPQLGFLGDRAQLGIVVTDMDAALKFWVEKMGVGPFVVFGTTKGDREFYHRGQKTDADNAIAFSYMGDLQIEIIQSSGSGPSTYKEFTDSGRQGLHHIAFWPEDYRQACKDAEKFGFKEVFSIRSKEGSKDVVYYETPPAVGIIVELVPMSAERKKYFGGIQALTKNWDGTRPIRKYKDRAEFLASQEYKDAVGGQ